MKTNVFEAATATAVRAIGAKHDLDVVFVGDGAATDGQTVYLAKVVKEEVSREEADVVRGYADHETAHVLCSDLDAMNKAARDQMMRQLLNAVEDMRIESAMVKAYPETQKHLMAVSDRVFSEFEVAEEDKGDLGLMPFALTCAGRHRMYGLKRAMDCLDEMHPKIKELAIALDKKFVAKLENPAELGDIKREEQKVLTREAIDAAREIARVLRKKEKAAEQPAPEPEAGPVEPEGGEGGEGEEGEGEGGGEATGEGGEGEGEGPAGGQGEGGAGEEGGGEVGSRGGSGQGEGESEGELKGGFKPGELAKEAGGGKPQGVEGKDPGRLKASGKYKEAGVSEMVKKTDLFSGGEGEGGGHRSYVPFSTKGDRVLTRKELPKDAGNYLRIKNSFRSSLGVMKRKLERAILSEGVDAYVGGQTSGSLDRRRLAAAVAGSTTVFRRKMEDRLVNTDVSILIDLSGSMRHNDRIGIANEVAVALCEALEPTGVRYEVAGFCMPADWETKDWAVRNMARKELKRRDDRFGRFYPIWHKVFKGFNDSLMVARPALGAVYLAKELHNCDGESIDLAVARMMREPGKKKVLMVLSDGQPEVEGDSTKIQEYTKRTIQRHIRDGVKVIGIGIENARVREYYPDYVVVKNLAELAGTVLDELSCMILGHHLGGRKKVA